MEFRTLRDADREALFALLDLWAIEEAGNDAAFFRRYVDDDPSFEDRNYWLACESATPVASVQIFPRPLQSAGRSVAMGGIGSVFTHPEHRRQGLAEMLLGRARRAMLERGMAISMLFAARIPWYTKLGWRSWGMQRTLLSRVRTSGDARREALPFDSARDLDDAIALHRAFSGARPGTVVRDAPLWRASLANAGNPPRGEEFLVARRGAELVAYARAANLGGFLAITEFAAAGGAEQELAALIDCILTPRDADPLAGPERPSEQLRGMAATVHLAAEPALAGALEAAGLALRSVDDPTLMLCCLDTALLAAQSGVEARPGESGDDLLRRVFPAHSFGFWPADRF